jgi:N6-L-threonylcarbamoyladenine synthase
MLTLGLETSCDETAVCLLKDRKEILSNIIYSSLSHHRRFGGIVPEIATRLHLEVINYVIEAGLRQAKVSYKDIGLICVTQGPGLPGALLVGVSCAKALGLALDIPVIAVNHLIAHIHAVFLEDEEPDYPFIALVVSGGHTCLVYVKDSLTYRLLGQTRDDACGEAFDKAAKILNLGYPGGPVIDKLAKKGNPKRIRFPRAYLGNSLDFSFSGLKTALLYYTEKARSSFKGKFSSTQICDIAASFQEAVVDVLIKKAIDACRSKKASSLVIGGGVSANSRLRERFLQEANLEGIEVYFPNRQLSLDNAAMVASLGYQMYRLGIRSRPDFTAIPGLKIGPIT